MTTLNIQNIRDELTDFFRRSDVFSTTVRGVTRSTGTYNVGVGGETSHTFTGNTPTRDFKSIVLHKNAYKEDFSTTTYMGSPMTANWNTSNGRLEMTDGLANIATFEQVYSGTLQTTLKLSCTEVKFGNDIIEYFISTDGNTWQQVYNGVDFTANSTTLYLKILFTGQGGNQTYISNLKISYPVNQYFLRDYAMNWVTGVLTWNVALIDGESVDYIVDWGGTIGPTGLSSDKIFPDLPRDDLSLNSFPRLGIEMTSISTEPLGLGGTSHISDFLITVIVMVPSNKDAAIASGFGGLADLEETMRLVRDAIRTYAKSFYTFTWITPAGTGPLMKGQNNKIFGQSQDFRIRFQVEN